MPRKPRNDGTDRRPRSDSKLMSLPDDRQRELFDFCDGLRSEGLRTIRERLVEAHGVKVSLGTLSNWLNWYSLRSKMRGVAEMADDLADILKKTPGLNLTNDGVMAAAQAYFEMQSMKENDAGLFVKMAKVRRGTAELKLKAKRLALEERKLRQAEEAKGITENKALTPEEKERRLKGVFGITG